MTLLVCEPESKVTRSSAESVDHIDDARRRRLRDRNIEFLPTLDYALMEELPLDLESLNRQSYLDAATESQLFEQMHLAAYRAQALLDRNEPCGDGEWESERLIERAENIRNTLAVVFSKLARSIARTFSSSRHPLDELLSESHAVMLRAIVKFDPSRGFRFSTYGTHAIRRRLFRYLHERQRDRRLLVDWPHDTFVAEPRRWSVAYERRMTAAVAEVEKLLLQLSSRERYIVRSRFGWGREFEPRTLQEIADELGISRERVRQLEARSLEKLRSAASTLDEGRSLCE